MGANFDPAKSPSGKKRIIDSQRTAEMLRLRIEGLTLDQIGERMGVSKGAVSLNIQRTLKGLKQESAKEYLALELARCDALLQEAMKTVNTFHPLISQGSVVMIPLLDRDQNPILTPQGKPIMVVAEDKAPKLAAIATALRIIERQSRFLGLDAPVKSSTAVTVRETTPSHFDYSRLSLEELDLLDTLMSKATVAPANRADAAHRGAVAVRPILGLEDGADEVIDAEIVDGEEA